MIIREFSNKDTICFYERELENISKEPFEQWFIMVEGDIVSVNLENRNDVIKRLQEAIEKLKVEVYGE